MFKKTLFFIALLFLACGILYGIHRLIIEGFFSPHKFDFLHFSYKFNLGVTLLFTSTIILISEKLKDQIGFVFLAETAIKIGLFLYLAKSLGFDHGKSNFFDFFVPYVGCLVVEIFVLVRLLKTSNSNNSS